MLGNFPQALSHVALVNSAVNLCKARGPAQRRAT
jgi:GH15 family glucan-1,4-alpha-glucosidase